MPHAASFTCGTHRCGRLGRANMSEHGQTGSHTDCYRLVSSLHTRGSSSICACRRSELGTASPASHVLVASVAPTIAYLGDHLCLWTADQFMTLASYRGGDIDFIGGKTWISI